MKCPKCGEELILEENSLTYQVKVWRINGKNFELSLTACKCANCGEELIFRHPIYGRAIKNTGGIFRTAEIESGVEDFVENYSDRILDIEFHKFISEYQKGE